MLCAIAQTKKTMLSETGQPLHSFFLYGLFDENVDFFECCNVLWGFGTSASLSVKSLSPARTFVEAPLLPTPSIIIATTPYSNQLKPIVGRISVSKAIKIPATAANAEPIPDAHRITLSEC